MKLRLIIISMILVATACMEKAPSPQDYIAPEFVNITSRVERSGSEDTVYLTAELNRCAEEYLCGFAWGPSPHALTRVSADREDRQFSLSISNLEADKEYSYYAYVNNGSYEIKSRILVFKTNKVNAVDPIDPPTPPPSNTGITVSDSNFLKYLLSLCDLNSDGKISIEEANTVHSMDFCTDNISLLDGIQYFGSLETLKCNGSIGKGLLDGIDLRYNTSLDSLTCRYNRISHLQLPQGYNFKSLDCSFNHLEQIDFSLTPGIEVLDCFNNKLSALDITALKDLKKLKCGMNIFETLDVSCNLKLELLDLSDSPSLKTVYVARGQKIETIIAENRIEFKYKE